MKAKQLDNQIDKLRNIARLNNAMASNPAFKAAISDDTGVRNGYNIDDCIVIVELYSYLYKHYELVPKIFRDTNPYMNTHIVAEILALTVDRTVPQAVNHWIFLNK